MLCILYSTRYGHGIAIHHMHTHTQNIISQKRSNSAKTFFLMALFFVAIIFLGFIISYSTGNTNYLYGAFYASLAMNFFSYFFSAKIALSTSGAEKADKEKYKELYDIVHSLAHTAHIKIPELYIINDPAPNAFATGRNENNASIAVTTGLLATMNKNELEGVLAHELSHIQNKDILIMTIVVVLAGTLSMLAHFTLQRSMYSSSEDRGGSAALSLIVGIIASIVLPLAATIVQLSISRKREFMADASGALITGHAEGLASALEKIGNFSQPLQRATNATAHLYIANPFGGKIKKAYFQKLFMTHPPLEERIAVLRGESPL